MKRIMWYVTALALLAGCSGIAVAQCAGNSNPGGFDLLQTSNGTLDNLSSAGLGTVNFQGLALPSGIEAGSSDTIVCRITPLPNPIPSGGATLNIQIVALYLQSTGTVTCNNSLCGSYYGKAVTVYATINQTNGTIPLTQLPQPDSLTPSTGTMTVYSNGTFNTNGTSVDADLIVVPPGSAVTAAPIFTMPMPNDSISASGSSWTSTAPAGYPTPPSFPAGGFYVNSFGSSSMLAPLITSGAIKGSLYGLGLLLFGLAVMKIRTGASYGPMKLRPIYLLAFAAIACGLAWRAGGFVIPTVAHAKAVCAPRQVVVWVNENGTYVQHVVQTATCSPQSVNQNPSLSNR
ncbi:MAG: hypothetical protein WBX38_03395 [Candidatus Sulfotelmatobacter sp.]